MRSFLLVSQVQQLWRRTLRFWKWLRPTVPVPRHDKLSTPVSMLQHIHVHANTLLAVLLLTTVCSLLSALTISFSLLSFLPCAPLLSTSSKLCFFIDMFIVWCHHHHPSFNLCLTVVHFNVILFLLEFGSNLIFMFFFKNCPLLQYDFFQTPILYPIWFALLLTSPLHLIWFGKAWQGTDLMHNHVLADISLTGIPGNPHCSDQSEDSDYDSIWTATSYRTASFSRKILVFKHTDVYANQLAYNYGSVYSIYL